MDATIRRATAADAAGIGEVHTMSWQWAYRGRLSDAYLDAIDQERRTAWWRRVLQAEPPASAFVAESATRRIVGFCHVGVVDSPGAGAATGELHAIYLLEEAVGKGLGTALMAVGLEELQALGCSHGVLWVLQANDRARRFYEHNGWVDEGTRRVFELGDGVAAPAVQYRIDLGGPAPA